MQIKITSHCRFTNPWSQNVRFVFELGEGVAERGTSKPSSELGKVFSQGRELVKNVQEQKAEHERVEIALEQREAAAREYAQKQMTRLADMRGINAEPYIQPTVDAFLTDIQERINTLGRDVAQQIRDGRSDSSIRESLQPIINTIQLDLQKPKLDRWELSSEQRVMLSRCNQSFTETLDGLLGELE